MKFLIPIIVVGLIIQYFMDTAFHVSNWNVEMLVHNLVRFFAGFAFLGIWVWYKQRLRFKVALYIILLLLISDDIFDYFRHIDSLSFEMIIHDLFLVLWGSAVGYFFIRSIKRKSS